MDEILKNKAIHSKLLSANNEDNLEIYKGYALDPNNPNVFNTKEEVNTYATQLLTKLEEY